MRAKIWANATRDQCDTIKSMAKPKINEPTKTDQDKETMLELTVKLIGLVKGLSGLEISGDKLKLGKEGLVTLIHKLVIDTETIRKHEAEDLSQLELTLDEDTDEDDLAKGYTGEYEGRGF